LQQLTGVSLGGRRGGDRVSESARASAEALSFNKDLGGSVRGGRGGGEGASGANDARLAMPTQLPSGEDDSEAVLTRWRSQRASLAHTNGSGRLAHTPTGALASAGF
jgi:hypothetical protein